MSKSAGHVMDHPGISPSTWSDTVRPQPAVPPAPGVEDWDGLPRLEAVVSRQRHFMVRDIVAAVGFAVLAIAVAVALL